MPKHQPASAWAVAQGHRLRKARLAAGLTQTDVAEYLYSSYQMIQKLEKGTARLSAEHAIILAKLFKTSLTDLLGTQ